MIGVFVRVLMIVSLAAGVAFLGYKTLRLISRPLNGSVIPDIQREDLSLISTHEMPALKSGSLENLPELYSRQILFRGRKFVTRGAPPKPSIVAPKQTQTEVGVRVLGIWSEPGAARALLETDTEKAKWYFVGEKIGQSSLIEISKDAVTLTSNLGTREIRVYLPLK